MVAARIGTTTEFPRAASPPLLNWGVRGKPRVEEVGPVDSFSGSASVYQKLTGGYILPVKRVIRHCSRHFIHGLIPFCSAALETAFGCWG